MGVPCQHPARPAGDHPDLHGPADHRRHCQPEGEQAEGKTEPGAEVRGWGGGGGGMFFLPQLEKSLFGAFRGGRCVLEQVQGGLV